PDTKDIAGDDSLALVLKFFGSENGEEKRDFVNLLKRYTSTGRRHNADILHDAIRAHDSTLVQKLLGDGRFPLLYDAEGQLPIILSMEEDVPVDLALEVASALLSHGAPIDQMKYAEKVRALFYAAWDHDYRKVDFLLKQGARPSIPDEGSPLSQAIFTSEESTRLLLEAGANPSICDSIGQPLLLALMNSYSRRSENVRLLLKYGSDSNAADKFGTVLHNILEHNGREAAAKILLEAGAAPFVKGWGGLYYQKTPLSVAQNHLKPFLRGWVSNEAKVIEYQLEEAMQPLSWSPLWKQRILSLYNGHPISLKANGPLHAHGPQGSTDFQVISEQDPANFLSIDPNGVVDTILPSIDRVQDLLAEDLLKDKHDFLSDHPHHENLLVLMKDLKRTKETLQIYRKVFEEDYYLDPNLTDQERLNHPSLNPYPIFKKNFTEALEKKKILEGN
ncbi:MAG: hypothetical protein JNJ47_07505, partial [Alphaproteobacteria bacterium]|nr:hypothetical protein [Alphaproteobacteria bacterium]